MLYAFFSTFGSILSRGDAELVFEYHIELRKVRVADNVGYFGGVHIRIVQQILSIKQSV